MEQSSIVNNKSRKSIKHRIVANKEGIIVWGALVLNMIWYLYKDYI